MSRGRAQLRSRNGPSSSRPGGSLLRLGLCCAFVEQPIHFRRTTARYVTGLKLGEATCSCGSGIPATRLTIDGETVALIALRPILEQLRAAGRPRMRPPRPSC